MPKYRVIVNRTGYRQADFEVEAESVQDAEAMALNLAGGRDFSSEYHADYEVEDVEQIELENEIVDPRLDQGILDDLVHDLMSENASAINNQGGAGQIRYILGVMGRVKGLQAVKEILEVPTLCPYHEDSIDWQNCTEDFEGCQVEQVRKAKFDSE
jgi:hypothetical protein